MLSKRKFKWCLRYNICTAWFLDIRIYQLVSKSYLLGSFQKFNLSKITRYTVVRNVGGVKLSQISKILHWQKNFGELPTWESKQKFRLPDTSIRPDITLWRISMNQGMNIKKLQNNSPKITFIIQKTASFHCDQYSIPYASPLIKFLVNVQQYTHT